MMPVMVMIGVAGMIVLVECRMPPRCCRRWAQRLFPFVPVIDIHHSIALEFYTLGVYRMHAQRDHSHPA